MRPLVEEVVVEEVAGTFEAEATWVEVPALIRRGLFLGASVVAGASGENVAEACALEVVIVIERIGMPAVWLEPPT